MMTTEEKISNEQEVVEEYTFWQKTKAIVNKAKLVRYLSLIAVVVVTVVLSFYNVGWDPKRIGWSSFIANTALLLFLGIYGLFFGETEGGSMFKSAITGAYQKAKMAFLDIVDLINKKSYVDALPDYISWRYQKDYQSVCHMKLISVRLFDDSVVNLTDEQLDQLTKEPLKIDENTYYSQLSAEQYKVIRDIKDGKIFVDYIDDYNFYIVEEANDGEQQVTKVKRTNARKEKISWKQRLSRVLMIIVVAVIVAGFFKETISGGDGGSATQEPTSQLASRLSTLIVSIASGLNIARLLNMEDIFVLNYKTSYNTVFYYCMENKTFTPINYKDKAKEEYEAYRKKKEEKDKRLIIPEIVDDNRNLIANKDE